MTKIADLTKYTNDMKKSLADKLFFLDHLDLETADFFVDFGCADGALIDALGDINVRKVGVDNNSDMYDICFAQGLDVHRSLDNVHLYEQPDHAVLNMSSVLHEVYSYLDKEQVENFWYNVFIGDYEYIVIRDMMVSNNTYRPADYFKFDLDNQYMKSFLDRWVPDTLTQKDLLHYLLKYKYTDNWDRELNEDYLGLTLEELKAIIPNNYEIMYEEAYVLPYLKEQVMKDFGYEITDPTHIKLILKRKAKSAGFIIELDKNNNYTSDSATVIELVDYKNWLANDKVYDIKFSNKENLSIKRLIGNYIPVGSINFVNKALKLLGCWVIGVPHPYDDFTPDELHRKVSLVYNLGQAINFIDNDLHTDKVFLKSVSLSEKMASGIYKKHELAGVNCYSYIQEVVNFVSEYRFFVYNGKIRGASHYSGNMWLLPDKDMVERMAKRISGRRKSFTLDVGVLDTGATAAVELHNFVACGFYGWEDPIILDMLITGFENERDRNYELCF